VKIDLSVHEDWVDWMKKIHIPEVLATHLFESHKMSRIQDEDEEDGITYAIQYVCLDQEKFKVYQSDFAPNLQKEHSERYGGKFIAFRTIMHIIDES